MKITFLGAAHEVTGSCTYLEVGDKRGLVDYGRERMTIEITGETSKVNAFIDNMKKYGIIEMCRTGIVALDRGGDNIWSEHED